MKNDESGENYLETVMLLQDKSGTVRSVDIAEKLGFTKPSVSRAMAKLRENGYIEMKPRGLITLTEKGRAKAQEIYERHSCITEYLMQTLAVDRETAEQDACRIEHIISQESFHQIKIYIQKQQAIS